MSGRKTEQRRGAAPEPYRLQDQVGFLLRQAWQRHGAIFSGQICHGLTSTQFAALAMLRERGPLPQNELGRQTAMDVATIKGVVDRLRDRGLARTQADPSDGRRHLVELTPAGRHVIRTAVPLARGITDATLAPLDPDERASLLRLLAKLV